MAHKSRAKRLIEIVETFQGEIDTAKEGAKTNIEELKDEITSWREGMEGTNLENTAKYGELEECEDALETLMDEIDSIEAEVSGDDIMFPGMY